MSSQPSPSGSTKASVLRWASGALLVVAVVAATYPWWTGVYTRWEQRRLTASEETADRGAAVPPRPERTREPGVFDGWEAEDAEHWRALAPGEAFGRLVIPAADVDVVVLKGVAKRDLKRGPGWIPGTSLPGPSGNAGIAGHRTTYLAPFRHIDRLRPGDEIVFRSRFRVYRYRVFRRLIVRPSARWVLAETKKPTLTLSACHPPYRATRRLIVRARLVAVEKRSDQ